jgi:hypothetical protein
MLHKRRSFTVPVSQGTEAMCTEKGHSAADRFGKCLCCGAKIMSHASLEGGPLDGEVVLSSLLEPFGRMNYIAIGDSKYFYDAAGEPGDDPRRFVFRGEQHDRVFPVERLATDDNHPTAAQTVESFKHLRNTRTE